MRRRRGRRTRRTRRRIYSWWRRRGRERGREERRTTTEVVLLLKLWCFRSVPRAFCLLLPPLLPPLPLLRPLRSCFSVKRRRMSASSLLT